MAIVKKIRQRRGTVNNLTDWQIRYLTYDGERNLEYRDFESWLDQMPWRRLVEGKSPVFLDELLSRHPETLWREFGEEYLAAFIQKYPGKRPLAWWQWDAPEKRKIFKKPDSLSGTESYSVFIAEYDALIKLEDDEAMQIVVESQAAFLRRLNLLTSAEKKKLTENDFDPETIIFESDGESLWIKLK